MQNLVGASSATILLPRLNHFWKRGSLFKVFTKLGWVLRHCPQKQRKMQEVQGNTASEEGRGGQPSRKPSPKEAALSSCCVPIQESIVLAAWVRPRNELCAVGRKKGRYRRHQSQMPNQSALTSWRPSVVKPSARKPFVREFAAGWERATSLCECCKSNNISCTNSD